jgi:tetratricopeptide (TPR) repeat protein
MRGIPILIVVAVLFTLHNDARADEPSPAEVLYNQGQAAYTRADYAVAVEKWQASFDLSGASGLLFNLAQAYRLSGDCTRALATYRRFAAADPTARQRPLAEDLVRELERTCVQQPPMVAAVVPSSAYPPPWHPLQTVGLVTGGAGIVSIAIGLYIGHSGHTIGEEVTAACALSCDWNIQKIRDADGHHDVTSGYVLDAIGLAAIAGGAIMYYFGSTHDVSITPASREGGAVVSWGGTW